MMIQNYIHKASRPHLLPGWLINKNPFQVWTHISTHYNECVMVSGLSVAFMINFGFRLVTIVPTKPHFQILGIYQLFETTPLGIIKHPMLIP